MAKIYCEHEFCRYWNNNHCTTGEIELSSGGVCQNQILVNIDRETLSSFREHDLKQEKEYWKEIKKKKNLRKSADK